MLSKTDITDFLEITQALAGGARFSNEEVEKIVILFQTMQQAPRTVTCKAA